MVPQANSTLVPPNLPFASNASLATGLLRTGSPYLAAQSSLSLSVNYLPTKFSDAVLYNGLKNRGKAFDLGPKRGGGREAFRSGEARMPGDGDEDYDGIQGSFFTKEGGRTKPRLRWNGFKWTLFFSNFLVSILSLFFDPPPLPPVLCFPPLHRSPGRERHLLISFFGSIFSSLHIPSLASYSCFVLGLTSGNMPTLSVSAIAPSSSCPLSPLPLVSSPPSWGGPGSSLTTGHFSPCTPSFFGYVLPSS